MYLVLSSEPSIVTAVSVNVTMYSPYSIVLIKLHLNNSHLLFLDLFLINTIITTMTIVATIATIMHTITATIEVNGTIKNVIKCTTY